MNPLLRKCLAIFALLFLVWAAYWYATEPCVAQMTLVSNAHGEGNSSVTEKDGCQFPDFDPFNPHAMKHYKKYPTTSCPNGMPTITSYNGDEIRVNQTHKRNTLGPREVNCWYRNVTYRRRVDYYNGAWNGPFSDVIKVAGRPEYVEVQCYDNESNQPVSRMHHYIVRDKERKQLKPPKHERSFQPHQMNVIMLCMDSMAGHLFKRAMPKTRNYLVNTLGVVEMAKYNKVGGGTIPNLLAISAGVYKEDVDQWTESEGFDRMPFLWKDFKHAGYRTQYMSDRADFDDFVTPPTDSYNAPMSSALMIDKVDFNNDCFEDQVEVKLWLDLILEFARESLFTTGRFFSFGHMNRPTHDFPNQASSVDEHYLHFFEEIHETGLLNNTFMVFFGDHGPRIEAYRRTFYGSIEERAANMVIYVPPWFRSKYPSHYRNLQKNSKRLTTNFDVHRTVRDLLVFPTISSVKNSDNSGMHISVKEMTRAISLFSEIPLQRTCEDASLTPHMCMCNGGVSVKNNMQVNQEVGLQVVEDINALLKPYSHLCAGLSLKSVSLLTILGGQVGRTALYRVILTTQPGEAAFEATVQYTVNLLFFKSIKTLGLISRVNMYRGQSDCITDDKLIQTYCYCKDVLAKKERERTTSKQGPRGDAVDFP